MLARVWSASIVGIDALKVGVEIDVSGGLPGIVVVGLPDIAVQESTIDELKKRSSRKLSEFFTDSRDSTDSLLNSSMGLGFNCRCLCRQFHQCYGQFGNGW